MRRTNRVRRFGLNRTENIVLLPTRRHRTDCCSIVNSFTLMFNRWFWSPSGVG